MNPDELCRALHLASPALPIGSFSYSQGLKTAVELGLIRKEDAGKWIADGLTEIIARCDAPVVAFIYLAAAWILQSIRCRRLLIGTTGSLRVANRWNYGEKQNKWVGRCSSSPMP